MAWWECSAKEAEEVEPKAAVAGAARFARSHILEALVAQGDIFAALRRTAPNDRATAAYAAVALGFNLVRGPRSMPGLVLLPLAMILVGVLALVIAPRARAAGPAGRFFGEFYPLLIVVGLYTHMGLVNTAGGVSHDATVQGWEQALFGGQPSLAWIRAFPSPAWSTVMHAAYLAYYPILIGAPLGLWIGGRRGQARETILMMLVTFYSCYFVFLVFPVAGPRYVFAAANNAATAVPVAVFTHRLIEGGSAWGTAFPSSHVAVALVASLSAWRGWRPLGAVLVPAAALLVPGTVYGQFHYAIDAIAGTAVATVVLAVRPLLARGIAPADRD